MNVPSEEQCFRRGCEELWTETISFGPGDYYINLCKPHDQELKRRAKELGGYSMVNAEDSNWRRGIPDNAWGWRLDGPTRGVTF